MNKTTCIDINKYERELINYINGIRKNAGQLIIGRKLAQNARFIAINFDDGYETNENRIITHFPFAEKLIVIRNVIADAKQDNVLQKIKDDLNSNSKYNSYLVSPLYRYGGVSILLRKNGGAAYAILLAQINDELMQEAYATTYNSFSEDILIDCDTILDICNKFREVLHLRLLDTETNIQSFLENKLSEKIPFKQKISDLIDYVDHLDGQFFHIANVNFNDIHDLIKTLFQNEDFLQLVTSSARGTAVYIQRSDLFLFTTYPPSNSTPSSTNMYARSESKANKKFLEFEPKKFAFSKKVNRGSPSKLNPNSTSNTPRKPEILPKPEDGSKTPSHKQQHKENKSFTPTKEPITLTSWKPSPSPVRVYPAAVVDEISKLINKSGKLEFIDNIQGSLDELVEEFLHSKYDEQKVIDELFPQYIEYEIFHGHYSHDTLIPQVDQFISNINLSLKTSYYIAVKHTKNEQFFALVIVATTDKRGSLDYVIYNSICNARAAHKVKDEVLFNKTIYTFACNAIDTMRQERTIFEFSHNHKEALSAIIPNAKLVDGCAFSFHCQDKKDLAKKVVEMLANDHNKVLFGRFNNCGLSIDSIEKDEYYFAVYFVRIE
ncbi:hypothetical protein TVAG_126190 [Trichomonas vaginalis G3]|uniref:Uncharacterized protein n=1 Tax=Trichomonas vaginalis (strain ATCC PRA-98 / G3) TaxID=412133 RepID=A2ED07_TRIV3|nr:hypothetical protein TVAGG3_0860670 [Trichomonas vaginalis G3]EAY09458.1 hypothetical protein TVAG_126190 [Trichomonas vaginalis G3]KAI5500647.1 hypothetical protein TVAGG3_0860670 [Trichomonas vaginalis G3]|eukprot:XP_001321681.1 hypothetical protein [Trichomonas vaginalis G3]